MKVLCARGGAFLGASLLGLLVLGAPAHAGIEPAPVEKLANGVELVARTDRTAPIVNFSLLVQCGSGDESAATAGWRRLAINAMLRGLPQGYDKYSTGPADEEGLSRAGEAMGGAVGATVGPDFVEILASGDSAHNSELLQLSLAVLQHPRLSDADIDAARQRLIDQNSEAVTDPAAKTDAALRGQLYRDASGALVAYGLPDNGTVDSLKSITNDQLRELYHSRLLRAQLVVGCAGDVDVPTVRRTLGNLGAASAFVAPAPFFAPQGSHAPALVVRELPVPAAWVFLSYAMPGVDPADTPALRVLTAALSDSSLARLPARLLARGLVNQSDAAYTVAAQLTPRRYADELSMFAQMTPQSVDRVKNAFLDEIRKLKENPLSPAELGSAKLFLRGSWSVERESLRDRAFHAAFQPIIGGADDTSWPALVDKVSAADVQRVAKKYLDHYAVALVMPQG